MVQMASLVALLGKKIKTCSDALTRTLLSHELIKLQTLESYVINSRKQTSLKYSTWHVCKASIRTGRKPKRGLLIHPHTDPSFSRLAKIDITKMTIEATSDTPSFNQPSKIDQTHLDSSLDYRGSFSFRIKPDESTLNLKTIPDRSHKNLNASNDTHHEHTHDELFQENSQVKPNPFKHPVSDLAADSDNGLEVKKGSFVINDSSIASNCSDTQEDRPRLDDSANPLQLSQANSGNASNLDRKHSNKVRGFNFKNKINTKKFTRPLITSTSSREVELLTRHILESQVVKPYNPRAHNDSLEPVDKSHKGDGFRKMSFEKSQSNDGMNESHSKVKKLNFNNKRAVNISTHENKLLSIDNIKKGS